MYVLIEINTGGRRAHKMSKFKNKLESYLKEKGYYFGKGVQRYINDKNSGILGGSGTDYIIQEVEEIN